jgi:hypothetical protein
MAASKKASSGLKAWLPKSKRGQARIYYLYKNGGPEVIEAFENRQLSLSMAEIIAHLPPEKQGEEVARRIIGKEKIVVLPATEEFLLKVQREEAMRAEVIAMDGLNEFQHAFRKYWFRLRRKYPEYPEGERWRLAESVIIRLSAPEINPGNPSEVSSAHG